MEALVVIGLVGNIVQFVDFSGKLISKSTELYRSSEGALTENIDIETVTNHLVLLNSKLKSTANNTGDSTLEGLCESCGAAAEELLAALDKVKVKGKQDKWKSIRKALRSVWSKEEIADLERRLTRLKEELNLHVVVGLSEQVSQFGLEQSDRLDQTTQKIVDAIVTQQDIFSALHDTKVTLIRALHKETVLNIQDEHAITRHEIIQEIRQPKQDPFSAEQQQHLSRLPYAPQAAFNSFDKQHDTPCLENTRVDILNEIKAWVNGQDGRSIFWLNGLAGTGKSTIARTIAREFYEQKCLGASFFFSRGDGDVSHAGKFFTSIALQLTDKSPILKRYICEAIAEQSNIANQGLRDQWRQLILQPLSNLDSSSSHPSLVIVVDALDECEGEKDIRIILQLFAEARSLSKVRLRVFMTSRPEVPIRHGFYQLLDSEHQDFVLHNISPSIIDQDITVFFNHQFKIIRQERGLAKDWPSHQNIEVLVRKAAGLFIWAATACRFISEGRRYAARRLSLLLEGNTPHTQPEKQLNDMYLTVLKSSVGQGYEEQEREELCETLRTTLGTIAILFSLLPAHSLARLLQMPKEDIDQTLDDLHSILNIPEDQSRPVRLHHPSFRDFLLDKARCNDPQFLVDEKKAHRALAASCLQLMSERLERDICGLHSPGVLATEVQQERIEQYLPTELQYACLYWVQHVQKGEALLQDDGQVHVFLQKHFLHWLEALSLMRKTSEGILALISLDSMDADDKSSRLQAFVHDAKRVALYNRSVGEEAPLQLYYSALVFSPKMSIIRRHFSDQTPTWICRPPEVPSNWSSLLQTLEGHLDSVYAVAFSPDSKLLASGSHDNTVKLWDVATGALQQTLEGHSSSVEGVAFSPDSKLLASGSDDNTVKLWDVATGALQQTLEGHSSSVEGVAFSPDSKLLASGSHDDTVKLWDVATGALQQTLEGHSYSVIAVAFSLDSKLLASGSHDDIVKLWDVATGALQQTLEGHSSSVYTVAFSPDSKLLASGSHDSTVKLWDVATGALQQTLEGHSSSVEGVAFSPDSKLLASGSFDSTVKLWDVATGALQQTLEGHSHPVIAVAFSPDSKLLASGSHDNTVKLWDVATGALQQTLEGHSYSVIAVAFSPDSKLLASGSHDNTIKLWDVATGALQQILEGHSHSVYTVAFSPDSKLLASGSHETVKLWDMATGALNQTLEVDSAVTRLSFSRYGPYLETERGLLRIQTTHANNSRLQQQPQPDFNIFVEERWVTRGTEKLLWLPFEYRAVCWDVQSDLLVLGHESGRITFIGFTFSS